MSRVGHVDRKPVNYVTNRIVSDLITCGFKRSYYHRTVGKLQKLAQRSTQKYQAYLGLFEALHKDLNMPNLVLKLILPEVHELVDMDVSVLRGNISLIRRNYVNSASRVCDLRKLPNLYPDLSTNK